MDDLGADECTVPAPAAQGELDDDWDAGLFEDFEGWPAAAPKAQVPDSREMRIVCEALHAYWCSPATLPNDALLSCYLLHDIGARNSPFTRLLCDSPYARLAYKALRRYDTNSCRVNNAGGVWLTMKSRLEEVLPKHLHYSERRIDDDEEESEAEAEGDVAGTLEDDPPGQSSAAV